MPVTFWAACARGLASMEWPVDRLGQAMAAKRPGETVVRVRYGSDNMFLKRAFAPRVSAIKCSLICCFGSGTAEKRLDRRTLEGQTIAEKIGPQGSLGRAIPQPPRNQNGRTTGAPCVHTLSQVLRYGYFNMRILKLRYMNNCTHNGDVRIIQSRARLRRWCRRR